MSGAGGDVQVRRQEAEKRLAAMPRMAGSDLLKEGKGFVIRAFSPLRGLRGLTESSLTLL